MIVRAMWPEVADRMFPCDAGYSRRKSFEASRCREVRQIARSTGPPARLRETQRGRALGLATLQSLRGRQDTFIVDRCDLVGSLSRFLVANGPRCRRPRDL